MKISEEFSWISLFATMTIALFICFLLSSCQNYDEKYEEIVQKLEKC